ncbi:MAG: nicotinate-nucleotide adenylyltransferase [Puniceicoccaceae bacterium]
MSPTTGPRRERIGLFGGTFDPIHIGHLAIAEDALREARLDRVIFVPAWAAPLRPEETGAEPEARLAMVRAAVAGHPAFATDDFEIRLARRVFTIETVRHFGTAHPGAGLFFLIGQDQFQQLDQWRDIGALRKRVTFLCALREGGEPRASAADAETIFLPPRRIDVSATEIRDRAARGEPVRSLVPQAVAEFIEREGLYRRG